MRAESATPPFSIRDYALDGEVHVVEVVGELDLLVAPDLRDTLVRLIEVGRTTLLVDLAGVTFIDSTAIGVLYGRASELRPSGGSLSVVCSDPNVVRTFRVAGMDGAFAIFAARDDFASR